MFAYSCFLRAYNVKMGYIKGFGFEIYRLREAKADSEFLLYNIKNNSYNVYSQTRALQILKQEFKQNNILFEKFIIDEVWKLEIQIVIRQKSNSITRKQPRFFNKLD